MRKRHKTKDLLSKENYLKVSKNGLRKHLRKPKWIEFGLKNEDVKPRHGNASQQGRCNIATRQFSLWDKTSPLGNATSDLGRRKWIQSMRFTSVFTHQTNFRPSVLECDVVTGTTRDATLHIALQLCRALQFSTGIQSFLDLCTNFATCFVEYSYIPNTFCSQSQTLYGSNSNFFTFFNKKIWRSSRTLWSSNFGISSNLLQILDLAYPHVREQTPVQIGTNQSPNLEDNKLRIKNRGNISLA